jgi:hypothetical protein
MVILVHKYSQDFANNKLASTDAVPKQWLTELFKSLRSEMNKVTIAGNSDMMDVDLTEEYEVAVSKLDEKLKDSTHHLDLEDVCEELKSHFAHITKHTEEHKDDKALLAILKTQGRRY